MNIVVLNGSPHSKGNTMALIEAFSEGARAKGHKVNVVSVCKMKIAGCIGCEYCHKEGKNTCIQKDDMQQVYELLEDAEMLVLASPVFYQNMTGQLKCAVDRLYSTDVPKNLKKAAMILSSRVGDIYDGLTFIHQTTLKLLKLEDAGMYTAIGDENKSPAKLEELRNFGYSL